MEEDSEPMIRPEVDENGAAELAKRLWGVRARTIVKLNGYDDKNFWFKEIEVEGNPNIISINDAGYVLKITNSAESKNAELLEEQNTILQNLAKGGVECPQPQKTITGALCSREQLEPHGPLHSVRLLSFVPGEVLYQVPWNPDFAFQAGQLLAQIDKILESTPAPVLERRYLPWSLWAAPKSLHYIDVVDNEADRTIVKEALTAFQEKIVRCRETVGLKESLIHGDYNEQNIVVRRRTDGSDAWFVAGVLDVGDAQRAPLLFEIALAAAYMALQGCSNGEEAADAAIRDVIAGYCADGWSIPDHEAKLLKLCICARLAQSLVLGLKTYQEDPSNSYVLVTQQYGWPLLRRYWPTVDQSP